MKLAIIGAFKKSYNLFALLLLISTPFLIYNPNAQAQQILCPQRGVQQLTDTPSGSNEHPSITDDGLLIAFDSSSDINGGNPDGNAEIYLVNTDSLVFTQITDETSGDSRTPSINADGTRIAFISDANINGGNPDLSDELYLYDSATGTITQITNSAIMVNFALEPSINADGTRIAFESNININGLNPDGNREIWLYNSASGTITQVTDTPPGIQSSNTSIDDSGTLITFRSNGNFGGGNPGGTQQIWLYNTTAGTFAQLTSGPGNPGSPQISGDGAKVAFSSTANPTGQNPEGNTEAFFIVIATSVVTQITVEPSGATFPTSTNQDGSVIALNSTANISGGNPEGNVEVYVYDSLTGSIAQVTSEVTMGSGDGALNADGTYLSFSSEGNGNPVDNFEIFLARCFNPMTARNVPTISEWGIIAMAGILGIMGLLAVRRRQRASAGV